LTILVFHKEHVGIPGEYGKPVGKDQDTDNHQEEAGNDLKEPDILFEFIKDRNKTVECQRRE
jgi:hypothetical protein